MPELRPYKNIVIPMLSSVAVRADPVRTARNSKINILRKFAGETRLDHARNEERSQESMEATEVWR